MDLFDEIRFLLSWVKFIVLLFSKQQMVNPYQLLRGFTICEI
jgi:hypothetical protein